MPERPDIDIEKLLELVNDGDITSLRVRVGDTEVFVSRREEHAGGRPDAEVGGGSPPAAAGPSGAPSGEPTLPAPGSAPPAQPVPPSVTAAADGRLTVKAPMVGVFYRAPEPGAEPYVGVGAWVDEDTTVGLIEAMKVYTAVPAGVQGTVEEVWVENAQFVDFDQPLFTITPTGAQPDG